MLTAADREAWQQGFERGRLEGLEAAAIETRVQEWQQLIARFAGICDELARPLDYLDEQTENELVRLALAVGAQLARRELAQDPELLIQIIREGVHGLPVHSRQVRVLLHPLDAAAIRERLAAPAEERAWTIVDDPAMSRGGFRILTDASVIDARFETRVATIVHSLLGDVRGAARTGE